MYEQQEPSAAILGKDTLPGLHSKLDAIAKRVSQELDRQGFTESQIKLEKMLHMRFNGSDTALMM